MRIRPRRRPRLRADALAGPSRRSGAVALAIAVVLAVAPLGTPLLTGAARAASVRLPYETTAPSPEPRTLGLQLGGYRTSLATDYVTAVNIPNGTYVTFRVTLERSVAQAPAEFHQRIGKDGDWTFLATGRTGASGIVTWSKVVRVPAEATGYDRYVYFKVTNFKVTASGTPEGIAVWSNAVRGVAKWETWVACPVLPEMPRGSTAFASRA